MFHYRTLVGDFETSVYDGQTETEVWAAAFVPVKRGGNYTSKDPDYYNDVEVFNSINRAYEYLTFPQNTHNSVRHFKDTVCYFHNLKFDGSFWLNYLIKNKHFNLALLKSETGEVIGMKNTDDLVDGEYACMVGKLGQWYSVSWCDRGHRVELRDSLKLLPFSVKEIGKGFQTKHQKTSIEYRGERHANGRITQEEINYIKNDVLVVKEALETLFSEGHNKTTIGACCLSEYKGLFAKDDRYGSYDNMFPNLYELPLSDDFGSPNVGEYVRKSYKGGWCYLVKGEENKVKRNGVTADVNSLYPSMMHSDSGNFYPYGKPVYIEKGKPWFEELDGYYIFMRFRCRFVLKDGMLPTVQIKGSPFYRSNVWLETSDVYIESLKKYVSKWQDKDGQVVDIRPELTMSLTDYRLFVEHYNIENVEYLDWIAFEQETGLFDQYINKWAEVKKKNKGAKRQLAKLFLNNLYGKMASSTDSTFKAPYIDDHDALKWITHERHDKTPGYIPIGSAITSYARRFTITAAQKNYHKGGRGFIYADTDSIHCDLSPDELVGVPEHPTDFNHWALESYWDRAIFVRQKTYVEHCTHEDKVKLDKPVYQVKCAGLPKRSAGLIALALAGENAPIGSTARETAFVERGLQLTDFKTGLMVPDVLKPRQISGGVLLTEMDFMIR